MPTRDELLTAAEAVVRERGFDRATTRLIARRAGCAEGSLYTHFETKHELLTALAQERLFGFPEQARRLPEAVGSRTVAANLHDLADQAVQFLRSIAPMIGMRLSQPTAGGGAGLPLHPDHGPGSVVRAVRDYLAAEQQVGRVSPDADLDGAAQALLGGCLSQAIVPLLAGPQHVLHDDAPAVDHLVRAVCAALDA